MKYLILILLLAGCSTVDASKIDWDGIQQVYDDYQENETVKSPEIVPPVVEPEPEPIESKVEKPIEAIIKPNIVKKPFESKQAFKGGNLWKPVAENGGNLVVLLKASNPDFKSCKVKLKNGSNHNLYQLKGYERTNGNRPTWRATKKCSEFKKVTVKCDDVLFTANSKQVCKRFE